MNVLPKYKGYISTIDFDAENRIFVGRIVGIRDGINFHGTSVDELEAGCVSINKVGSKTIPATRR